MPLAVTKDHKQGTNWVKDAWGLERTFRDVLTVVAYRLKLWLELRHHMELATDVAHQLDTVILRPDRALHSDQIAVPEDANRA